MNEENKTTEENQAPQVKPSKEEVLESVGKQLSISGLSDIPRGDVIDLIEHQKETLKFTIILDDDPVEGIAHFRHDSEKGKSYLNSYDVAMKIAGKDEVVPKSISCFYGNTYTPKEVHKLAKGASIFKNFYNADEKKWEEKWAFADLKNKDKNGDFLIRRTANFDLDKVLQTYPIKDYDTNMFVRANIKDTLKAGNLAKAIIDLDGKETTVYIKANAQYNSINLLHENMTPVYLKPQKKEVQAQSENQDVQVSNAPTQTEKVDSAEQLKPGSEGLNPAVDQNIQQNNSPAHTETADIKEQITPENEVKNPVVDQNQRADVTKEKVTSENRNQRTKGVTKAQKIPRKRKNGIA